ncbi:MAG TPA: CAP domain-containing protein [Gaiellaceae bacterium]|nr:CAP domain-containing protein [Gaiellaceae bacterium]
MSRFRVLAATFGVLVAIVAPAGASTDGNGNRGISSRAALERSIVSEINALRTSRGLRPLVISKSLASVARSHSRHMARVGYFAHVTPSGVDFAQRVRRHYRTAGFRSWRAGENLLWASPDVEAGRAVELWLESPSHRRVLLAPAWREIGLSAVHTAAAPRVFAGLEVTIVTADFGARLK